MVNRKSNEPTNSAAKLYEWMDDGLQNTFFKCYQVYGKISTKKLVACFDDPTIIKAMRDIVKRSRNGIEIPARPPSQIILDKK